jgi:hypothetical protein
MTIIFLICSLCLCIINSACFVLSSVGVETGSSWLPFNLPHICEVHRGFLFPTLVAAHYIGIIPFSQNY